MLKIKIENFKKCLKQKRCAVIRLHVPNLLQIYEKINFRVKKMQKTLEKRQFSQICKNYEFFAFNSLNIDFFVNMKQVWNI